MMDRHKTQLKTTSRAPDPIERKQPKAPHLRTRAEWERTFDALPDMIFVLDTNYRIVRANKSATDRLGLTPDQIVGQTCFTYVHGTAGPLPGCPHSALAADGKVHFAEIFVDRLGAFFVVSVTPLFDPSGKLLGSVHVSRDISDRKRAEETLRESEEKHRTLFETMAQGVVYQNAAGEIISANPSAEHILGLNLDQMKGRTSFDPRWRAIHEDGSDFPGDTHPALVALRTERAVRNVVMGVFHPQEEKNVWINISAVPQFKPGESKPYQVFTTFEDITERKRYEEALRQANLVVENSQVVLFRWKAIEGWPVEFVSHNVIQFGYLPEELLSGAIPYAALVHPEDLERVAREVQEHTTGDVDQFQQEYRIVTKDGRVRWLDDRTVIERDKAGRVTHYQGVVIDITERKETEKRLLFLSTHDVLTGLYSRAIFEEEMARLERGRDFPIGIIVIDVNGMKATNDTLGHAAGDDLLRRAAQVFKSAFRAEDIVARIGGDEFAALLPNSDTTATEEVLARIRQHVALHNRANPNTALSLAVGTATCPKGETLGEALKEADKRMYMDKFSVSKG